MEEQNAIRVDGELSHLVFLILMRFASLINIFSGYAQLCNHGYMVMMPMLKLQGLIVSSLLVNHLKELPACR